MNLIVGAITRAIIPTVPLPSATASVLGASLASPNTPIIPELRREIAACESASNFDPFRRPIMTR